VFHGKQKSNPCSLLQLAVRCAKGKREVFVIDLLKLQPKVYNAALSKLFLSKQIIKLGQGLLSDLKVQYFRFQPIFYISLIARRSLRIWWRPTQRRRAFPWPRLSWK
jgi:hypothetical protein